MWDFHYSRSVSENGANMKESAERQEVRVLILSLEFLDPTVPLKLKTHFQLGEPKFSQPNVNWVLELVPNSLHNLYYFCTNTNLHFC